MYAQARKWQSKTGTQTWLTSKFKVSHSQGRIFFPKVRQHFLMPTCSFKRKTISTLSCESEEVGKGCALNLPSLLTHLTGEGHRSWSPVQSQAWQATARELGSRCLSPGGGNSLTLFDSSCWKPTWNTAPLLREKECSSFLALSGTRRLARWRHSNQNRLNSALVYFTTCAQGPE